jgi:hypothetical protein
MKYEADQIDSIQRFTTRLNSEPPQESVESTPDRKASTVVISHIEMSLDELFLGQWRTEHFTWSTIANEVVGSLELVVIHPVTGNEIRRVGAASIVITVDKVPDELRDNPQHRNQWAINPANKKPNALDLGFPKLKTECLKNAAQSLGKIFGRDLNRKNRDQYRPFKVVTNSAPLGLPASTMQMLEDGIKSGSNEYEIRTALSMLGDVITPEQQQHIDNLFKTFTTHE